MPSSSPKQPKESNSDTAKHSSQEATDPKTLQQPPPPPPDAEDDDKPPRQNTYQYQGSLPRLPIPELDTTMLKFRDRLEALLGGEDMLDAERTIMQFLETDGPILQKELHQYEADGCQHGSIGSYIEEFWNDSYLSPDSSVVLNLNPFFVLEDSPDPKINCQLYRAASLTFAAVCFASALRAGNIAPDIVKKQPLCMDQFKALFGSSRQPTLQSDNVHVYHDSSHVCVIARNQFYYFKVLCSDTGNVCVKEKDVMECLKAILADSQHDRVGQGLGVFTSLPRTQWSKVRQHLVKLADNESALQIVDSALFVLALDDYVPTNIHKAAANVLHGTNLVDGMQQIGTCLNRWYDKLQLVVCKDGTSGLVFEHSIIDGHTALRFVSDVYAETLIRFAESIIDIIHGRGKISHVIDAVIERKEPCVPKKLVFELDESLKSRLFYAETNLCDEIHASDTYVLEYKKFGKKLIVANKMSPDAFVQMSILSTYYRQYGNVACLYEPALTKRFFHGRTEAIRGTTMQAKHFCEAFVSTKTTTHDKVQALRMATNEHSRLTKEAANGMGIDRHLFALKCIAERNGHSTAFFESKAWKKLNHTVLSTSNCGNPALRLFGFGPVVPDGFGIGYIIKDYGISYSVCSRHRQTARFVHMLETTLTELQGMLEPIAKVEVIQKGSPLIHKKKVVHKPTANTYGDLWGAKSDDEASTDSSLDVFLPPQRRESSKLFSGFHEHRQSVDLFLRKSSFSVDVSLDGKEK